MMQSTLMPTPHLDTPVIETARLRLRGVQPGDWPAYRSYRLSARSTMQGAGEADIWTHFAAFAGHWALKGYGRFIIEHRASARPIGHVGPLFPDCHPEPELTWTLWAAGDEGQGFAREAAAAARDFCFVFLRFPSAVSYIETANARSRNLALKLGARQDPAAQAPYPATEVWRHDRGLS
jgi:RimJ/RimL family protein N-acetyltransferase